MNKFSPKHYQRGKIQVWDFIADQNLDFILGNFAGINLTYFLGAASSFAPIALVLVGGAIMKMSD